MRTTIEIDEALMTEAQRASGQTKKATVEEALRLLVPIAASIRGQRGFR
jgi:Arc/MetJ family transcription regulator